MCEPQHPIIPPIAMVAIGVGSENISFLESDEIGLASATSLPDILQVLERDVRAVLRDP